MTEKRLIEPTTYQEFLERQANNPWLFVFDQVRFNNIAARYQQKSGYVPEVLVRARGLLLQQCYGRSKKLHAFGYPVPASQLVDPCYIGDIAPGRGMPSVNMLQLTALIVLDYVSQPSLTLSERQQEMS